MFLLNNKNSMLPSPFPRRRRLEDDDDDNNVLPQAPKRGRPSTQKSPGGDGRNFLPQAPKRGNGLKKTSQGILLPKTLPKRGNSSDNGNNIPQDSRRVHGFRRPSAGNMRQQVPTTDSPRLNKALAGSPELTLDTVHRVKV